MANRYRKKPVVIEAVELTWANWDEVCQFVGVPENGHGIDATLPALRMVIHTLEGDMIAKDGDFIIKGVQGEFYPCKPDIFAQTYDIVADTDLVSQDKDGTVFAQATNG